METNYYLTNMALLNKWATEKRETGYTLETRPILSSYIKAAMLKIKIEELSDGSYYAEIPECHGVWANEETKELCISDSTAKTPSLLYCTPIVGKTSRLQY